MDGNIRFSNTLIMWYLLNKRDLPWRKTKEPYFIWLSEIILQQTKIAQGTSYYLKFIDRFNKISHLANASEDEILKLWQGLGYYSRARNLHHTAQFIDQHLDGVFPNKYTDLIQLKGIGDYTASAILSICFNKPHATVDGNVYRVLSRYFGVSTVINSPKGIKEFKKLAQLTLDHQKPGTHNQAIMEFGAIVCKPKIPNCNTCPLNNSCYALQNNLTKELPIKINKVKIRNRFFNFLVVDNGVQTVITQRIGKDIWKNLFEFPLYESDSLISAEDLINTNEFHKLIGSQNFTLKKFNKTQIIHKLTHQNLYTTFWIINIKGELNDTVLWKNISDFAIPTLIQNFIDKYRIAT